MKIEDDGDDIQVQDLDQDQGVDQDRVIVDAGEDHPPDDPEQEVDHVNDHGLDKRRFQKNQLEVENILRIQMMINQSNLEKIVSWIGSNVILGMIKLLTKALKVIWFSFERKFAMAEENIRKKNENKPKDEFGWDEGPVSLLLSSSLVLVQSCFQAKNEPAPLTARQKAERMLAEELAQIEEEKLKQEEERMKLEEEKRIEEEKLKR